MNKTNSKNIFYTDAKDAINEYLRHEFEDLSIRIKTRLIDFLYKIGTYEEEGVKLKPSLILTNDLEKIVDSVNQAYQIKMFEDEDESLFNARMKALIPFSKHNWNVFIEFNDKAISYGVCKTLNSIKEKNISQLSLEDENLISLNEKNEFKFIHLESFATRVISMQSINGENLNINMNFDSKKPIYLENVIQDFVDCSFSKLRTTKRKLHEIKTLYENIFYNAFKSINGAICVVVDKDYIDKGFLSDGVWLEQPIEFSKLFLQSKSYNESKLRSIADIFTDMLNYDGITVVDNIGRVRAYNVFVETNTSRVKTIIGGARKRAAFTIINSRRKNIKGVYFQSQDGEVFFEKLKK